MEGVHIGKEVGVDMNVNGVGNMKITYNKSAVQQLRKSHNLTISQFARRAGLSRQIVSYLEKHKPNPRVDTLILIAQAFELSMDYFIVEG